MQASQNRRLRPAAPPDDGARRPRERWSLWLLAALAVLLSAGLVAFGSVRGWHPADPFSAAPDLTATAVAVEPSLRDAAQRDVAVRFQALACACDPGLDHSLTGPALTSREQAVSLLRREVRRRTTTIRHLQVISARLLTPTTAVVSLSLEVSESSYQGLVLQDRDERMYRELDNLVLSRGLWKVARIRTTTLSNSRLAHASAPPTTAAAVYILDDSSRHELYAANANAERLVASTAKMVTALVALRDLPLGRYVTVPPDAAVVGTTAGLTIGETLRVRDLLYGMLLPSGNDAAVTLADASAGSLPTFAGQMNAEVARLGLTHSHFVTPHGLDSYGQYSTAHDLAWIAHALLHQPFLAQVVSTRSYRAVSAGQSFVHVWTNLNHLLGAYPGAVGVKTGTTPGAGANLVAAAVHGGRRLIVVVLGDTVANRFPDATRLLNYGWRLLGYNVG